MKTTFMTSSIHALDTSKSQRSDLVLRSALSRTERDEMFALLSTWFTNVGRTVFERDLAEKEWVILLRDDNESIAGFSTLMLMEVDGVPVFFSGDTIVAPHRWGSFDLPRLWGRHVFSVARQLAAPDIYWFLISSGYRTYRFLPLFFREFHPAPGRETPAGVKHLLDRIATAKYGEGYDAESGVVRLATPAPLRPGLSDPAGRIEHDAWVRFFVEANPGHAAGDELACLVRVAHENLTPAGLRMLR
jgi:hypothetical protein